MNIRSIFRQLVPPACLLCGADAGMHPVCAACRDDLPWHVQPQCPRCASPSPGGATCGACLKRAPTFDRTVAALAYAFPADRLVPRLKYGGQLAAAPLLGACLAEAAVDAPRPDRLVAMPLHPARLRQRGFNPATELARIVAEQLGVPLDAGCCRRVRDTPPQVALKYDARRRNVRGAFACSGDVAGLHLALVDDVMTTGTSLDELAATFKRAGAREVSCWVAARTLPPGETR